MADIMQITRIKIKNWRNFKYAEVRDISDVVYLLGPNASGKSNFLDAMRFLRDLAKPKWGGLQEAVASRGGISKIRCRHARKDTEVLIEVDVRECESGEDWNYVLGFNIPPRGFEKGRSPVITREIVNRIAKSGEVTKLVNRPNNDDRQDSARLQQTHIEHLGSNKEFRALAEFFGSITYCHLVPQLLKFGDEINGRTLEDDPYGQEFLLRVSGTQERKRNSRLRKIERILKQIVPHMEDLKFVKDDSTGHPHLEMKFRHYRPDGARQQEDEFSDGTLRLIALFWLLMESNDAPILLEEPELSLNEEIARELARLIESSRRMRGKDIGRQLFISTQSYALLSNPGIDSNGIIVIQSSDEGSIARKVNKPEKTALSRGMSPAEVVLPNLNRMPLGEPLRLEI